MARKTYRVNRFGTPLFVGGARRYDPGQEIEMEERDAIELADCLERDSDGNPVIIRKQDAQTTDQKALDDPPADKMIRRSRTVRK